jgi:hypothetical protein
MISSQRLVIATSTESALHRVAGSTQQWNQRARMGIMLSFATLRARRIIRQPGILGNAESRAEVAFTGVSGKLHSENEILVSMSSNNLPEKNYFSEHPLKAGGKGEATAKSWEFCPVVAQKA